MIKRFIPFFFAGILGLVAVIMMQQYLNRQRQALDALRKKLLAEYQAPIEVVVAKKDIPEGTTIAADYLGLRQIPEKFTQPYATRNPGDLIGMVTAVPVAEGEQVLRNKVRRPSEASAQATLSGMTPKGKRAITIGIDALTGVGGFVRPGDTVDLLWTFQVQQPGSQGRELVTVTLFQNVSILGVGGQMVGRPGSEGEQAGAGGNTVTLALDPQETALVLFAREQGQISLALRSRLDKDQRVEVPPTMWRGAALKPRGRRAGVFRRISRSAGSATSPWKVRGP